MFFGENSNINPFAQMTKNRIHMRNNPFELGKRDFQELNLNNTLKSKPRPSQYPKLEINPLSKKTKKRKLRLKRASKITIVFLNHIIIKLAPFSRIPLLQKKKRKKKKKKKKKKK